MPKRSLDADAAAPAAQTDGSDGGRGGGGAGGGTAKLPAKGSGASKAEKMSKTELQDMAKLIVFLRKPPHRSVPKCTDDMKAKMSSELTNGDRLKVSAIVDRFIRALSQTEGLAGFMNVAFVGKQGATTGRNKDAAGRLRGVLKRQQEGGGGRVGSDSDNSAVQHALGSEDNETAWLAIDRAVASVNGEECRREEAATAQVKEFAETAAVSLMELGHHCTYAHPMRASPSHNRLSARPRPHACHRLSCECSGSMSRRSSSTSRASQPSCRRWRPSTTARS